MTNAGMIEALRYCGNDQECSECPLRGEPPSACFKMMLDAADALEAADKRIAELSLDNKMLKNTIDADKGVMLDRIRFLEARLPKEGEWIEDEYGYIHCSRCRMEFDEPEHPQTNFCPNCGARMRGEHDGET